MQVKGTGTLTYSVNKIKRWYAPLSYERIEPKDVPVVCDAINGNGVLIPQTVAQKIGNLSKKFTHGAGDYDYSLRAKKLGFASYIPPVMLELVLKILPPEPVEIVRYLFQNVKKC